MEDAVDDIGEDKTEAKEETFACADPECTKIHMSIGSANICSNARAYKRKLRAETMPGDKVRARARPFETLGGDEMREDEKTFYKLLKDNKIENAKTIIETYYNNMQSINDLNDPAYTIETLQDCGVNTNKQRAIIKAKHKLRHKDLINLKIKEIEEIVSEEEERKKKEAMEPKVKGKGEEDEELKQLQEFELMMTREDMKEMKKLGMQEKLQAMRDRVYKKKEEPRREEPQQSMIITEPMLDEKGVQRIDPITNMPMIKTIKVPISAMGGMPMFGNPYFHQQPPVQPHNPGPEQPSITEVIKEVAMAFGKRTEEQETQDRAKRELDDRLRAMDDKYLVTIEALKGEVTERDRRLQEEREERRRSEMEQRAREQDARMRRIEELVLQTRYDKEKFNKEIEERIRREVSSREGSIEEKKAIVELQKSVDRSKITTNKVDRLADLGLEFVDAKLREDRLKSQPPPDLDEEEKKFAKTESE